MANKVIFDVGFNVDKSQLNSLNQQLEKIKSNSVINLSTTKGNNNLKQADAELQKIKQTTLNVQTAMQSAFNAKLNTFNIDKFNASLARSNTTLGSIGSQYAKLGTQGTQAFNQLITAQAKLNTSTTTTTSFLSQIGDTFTNAAKWSAAYGIVNKISDGIRQSIDYIRELDTELNHIQIVSGKSADEMGRFAVQANKAARELGASTKTFAGTAQTFFQQGKLKPFNRLIFSKKIGYNI